MLRQPPTGFRPDRIHIHRSNLATISLIQTNRNLSSKVLKPTLVAIVKQLEGVADNVTRRLVSTTGDFLGYQPLEFRGQRDVHSDPTVSDWRERGKTYRTGLVW